MKHDDTICFVCKPTWIMYLSAGLNDKMRTVRDNSITISKVIVVLNVLNMLWTRSTLGLANDRFEKWQDIIIIIMVIY